jgi:hypothetical protein
MTSLFHRLELICLLLATLLCLTTGTFGSIRGYDGGGNRLLAANSAPKPLATGLRDEGLEAFAQSRGATTWKQLPKPEQWKAGVLEKLADPKMPVHFNLDGVNPWAGAQQAAAGRGGPTDWELLQIKQNPQFWDSLRFWEGGKPAANPFK